MAKEGVNDIIQFPCQTDPVQYQTLLVSTANDPHIFDGLGDSIPLIVTQGCIEIRCSDLVISQKNLYPEFNGVGASFIFALYAIKSELGEEYLPFIWDCLSLGIRTIEDGCNADDFIFDRQDFNLTSAKSIRQMADDVFGVCSAYVANNMLFIDEINYLNLLDFPPSVLKTILNYEMFIRMQNFRKFDETAFPNWLVLSSVRNSFGLNSIVDIIEKYRNEDKTFFVHDQFKQGLILRCIQIGLLQIENPAKLDFELARKLSGLDKNDIVIVNEAINQFNQRNQKIVQPKIIHFNGSRTKPEQ